MPENSKQDITAWLEGIGLGQYSESFAAHHITLETLRKLTDDDLKECGVASLGHRKQLLEAVRGMAAGGKGVPKKLAHFELQEPLGRGGMGIVFRALDTALKRQVAVKVLDRSLAESNPQFRDDFIREAKSAAGINHPHIVQIYFTGEDKGEHFIAMELLQGQNMADRLARGPMDQKTVLQLARQIIEALSATSARRLIHGDIKPHNIFITSGGKAKLLDFGLSKKANKGVAGTGSITGSAIYMSPERVRQEPEDFRSDIYSLGATMFEALSGFAPFEAETPLDVAKKRLTEDAPRLSSVKPDVPAALDNMIARMLAREPSARYASYSELLSDLTAVEIAPRGFDPGRKSAFTIPGRPSAAAATGRLEAPPAAPVPDVEALTAAIAHAYHAQQHEPPKPSLWRKITSRRFLFISIAAHALFALIATIYVVQTVTAQRKLTFSSAPPSQNPSQRSLEHKVQLAKKQNTMSAPAQAKRITSTGLAKVSLPDMPSMAMSTDFTPGKMSGMGGTGIGMGIPGGTGMGGGGGGGGIPFFGLRSAGTGLAGVLYDLKQTNDGKPSGVDNRKYTSTVYEFVRSGWRGDYFKKYFKAPVTLYAPMIMMPSIPADDGPKAFGAEKEVKPGLWVALYKGRVTAPESGKFYFVGAGDDILIVRFNGRVVLDRCWEPQIQGQKPACKNTKNYHFGWLDFNGMEIPNGFARGESFSVIAGNSYNIEILIGEQPGGIFSAALLLEKDGADYERNGNGDPVNLPVFRVANKPPPPNDKQHATAPHSMDGPVWQIKPDTGLGRGILP